MSNIEMEIVTRGSVSVIAKGEIVNTLKDCYRKFGMKVPYKVEILITDTEAILQDYLRQEKFKTGIIDDTYEDSICMYDTWKGYPRISIAIEKLREYSKQARTGFIRHQSAHSVLHGSLEYRIFKIPEDCQQTAMIKNISPDALQQATQKLSLAVKDCEASKLLVENSYINCQLSFALEWIRPEISPRTVSRMTRLDRQQNFIEQIELLKPILFAHPLMAAPRSKKTSLEKQVLLGRRIEELLESRGYNEQNKILQVASIITENLTRDTHYNMDIALHQAMNLA